MKFLSKSLVLLNLLLATTVFATENFCVDPEITKNAHNHRLKISECIKNNQNEKLERTLLDAQNELASYTFGGNMTGALQFFSDILVEEIGDGKYQYDPLFLSKIIEASPSFIADVLAGHSSNNAKKIKVLSVAIFHLLINQAATIPESLSKKNMSCLKWSVMRLFRAIPNHCVYEIVEGLSSQCLSVLKEPILIPWARELESSKNPLLQEVLTLAGITNDDMKSFKVDVPLPEDTDVQNVNLENTMVLWETTFAFLPAKKSIGAFVTELFWCQLLVFRGNEGVLCVHRSDNQDIGPIAQLIKKVFHSENLTLDAYMPDFLAPALLQKIFPPCKSSTESIESFFDEIDRQLKNENILLKKKTKHIFEHHSYDPKTRCFYVHPDGTVNSFDPKVLPNINKKVSEKYSEAPFLKNVLGENQLLRCQSQSSSELSNIALIRSATRRFFAKWCCCSNHIFFSGDKVIP